MIEVLAIKIIGKNAERIKKLVFTPSLLEAPRRKKVGKPAGWKRGKTMQYLIKDLMVSVANMILGAFMGMIIHISYAMMNGVTDQILGMVGFFGGIVVCFVYCFLLKKFVMGEELSIVLPAICMGIGVWIGWSYNVYA